MDFNVNGFSDSQKRKQNKLAELNSKEIYDIIIIGGGPAGLTAAVYSIRKELKTALITY